MQLLDLPAFLQVDFADPKWYRPWAARQMLDGNVMRRERTGTAGKVFVQRPYFIDVVRIESSVLEPSLPRHSPSQRKGTNLEVPEQSLLAQFFFRFHDFFFFFIKEKLRRLLSPIFFDLSSSNFFLQFSLNFFYLIQSTYCC